MPRSPLSLTVLGRHGARDPMTCHYRCGDACSHPEPNKSGNEHLQEVISRSLSRRSMLKGVVGGAGALVLFRGTAVPAAAAPPGSTATLASDAFCRWRRTCSTRWWSRGLHPGPGDPLG